MQAKAITTAGSPLLRHLTAAARNLADRGTPGEVQLPGGETLRFGEGPPSFRIVLKNQRALHTRWNEFALGKAYVEGDIDLEGDLMTLLDARDQLGFTPHTIGQFLVLAAQLVLPPTLVNKSAITYHYSFGDDFYLSFIDKRYRFYSHCIFETDDDTLEEAAEHKLESMWNALGLQPGMRLLDIGGGWGGVIEYCGKRGVHVTSLTLVEDSANYIRNLIKEQEVPGEVLLEDILEHRPAEPYDHAVIYGVIEHIPNYKRFCQQVWAALKPGGRLYVDASATKQKYAMSAFTRHYTWRGHHTFLAMQDMVEELLFNGFEVVEVKRETHDYEMTIRGWAENLDANHDKIASQWSEELYRSFRIFLWGGAHAFRTNRLQAYHLVAERRADPGPRPGTIRRFAGFLTSLR